MKENLKALLIWRIPGRLIRFFGGEASQLILRGHKVYPGVLIKNNFNFEAQDIETCIKKLENN